jgi:hypothetical protein
VNIIVDILWYRFYPSHSTLNGCHSQSPIIWRVGGVSDFFCSMGSNAWNLPISITVCTGSYDA